MLCLCLLGKKIQPDPVRQVFSCDSSSVYSSCDSVCQVVIIPRIHRAASWCPFSTWRTISGGSGYLLSLAALLLASFVFPSGNCPHHKLRGPSGGVAHKSAGVSSARALNRPERFHPLHLNCRTGCSSHVTGARPDHRNLSGCSLWLSGLLTFSPSSTT